MSNFNLPKPTAEQNPLIAFFEALGYHNVQIVKSESLNTILSATKDDQKYFIKKFNPNGRPEEINLERITSEVACYERLPSDILIDAVELNIEERYIILNWVDLEDTGNDPKSIEALVALVLNVLPQIDASFLPEVQWNHYEEVFEKARKLYEAGIIEDPKDVIAFFESKKDFIMNAKKAFAHQDFNRRNVKTIHGKIKLFDFELSRPNNVMVDMASLYVDNKKERTL